MRRDNLPVAIVLCYSESSEVCVRHLAIEVSRCAIGLRQVLGGSVCDAMRRAEQGCAAQEQRSTRSQKRRNGRGAICKIRAGRN